MLGEPGPGTRSRHALVLLALMGAFLTLRGYRCLEGDQAYRLPILLHAQDSRLYEADPFVRSFDAFNPHRGVLAILGALSGPLGLTGCLAVVFVAVLGSSAWSFDRLAREAWPELGAGVGPAAVALGFATLAGNIGTNHLFEPILLDRQIAFALGWLATLAWVRDPGRGLVLAAGSLGAACVVHPTLGLQLGCLLAAWLVGADSRVPGKPARPWVGIGVLALATVPGLWVNLRGVSTVTEGVDPGLFRLLSLELQGPQHMLPRLWRRPQWLAWLCFPALAILALADARSARVRARDRLAILLAVDLLGLLLAWVGIECLQNARLTLFQPFRMATVARGLCLVLLAGHWIRLWRSGTDLHRTRAGLLLIGLTGDWRMVVVSVSELVLGTLGESASGRLRWLGRVLGLLAFGGGCLFLARHDTESGHVPLLVTVAVVPVANRIARGRGMGWSLGRLARVAACSWALPLVAMFVACFDLGREGPSPEGWRQAVARRWRFGETPVDDVERLGLWCRANTSLDARFIGPPGPKTFRLWSRRSLAFNRAGSPYNARGLVDWANRFRDHVGHSGDLESFVRTYLRSRHELERGFERMDWGQLADLARREGADFVLALAPTEDRPPPDARSGLRLARQEGRMAVYAVEGSRVADSRGVGTPGRR